MLEPGALLAVLLAVASVAVLAGGRMAERTRRVGLLKAAGSTPGLVASVLVAENLALALLAAAAGLVIGWAAAPLITNPGAGLIGTAGPPSITPATIGLTVALALAVALASTLVPAIKAARRSTVSALADSPRPPRRRAALIALSARLPVPLLLGIRMAAGRLRRAVLGAAVGGAGCPAGHPAGPRAVPGRGRRRGADYPACLVAGRRRARHLGGGGRNGQHPGPDRRPHPGGADPPVRNGVIFVRQRGRVPRQPKPRGRSKRPHGPWPQLFNRPNVPPGRLRWAGLRRR